MFKFTKTSVFCWLIILLFCLVEIFIFQYSMENEINEDIMKHLIIEQEEYPVIKTNDKIVRWQIEIPKISLIAQISEGTSKDVLNKHIGHIENTSKQQGNVGLAVHNRDLKLLKKGDEIKYKYNEFEKTYEVEKCRIIKDTELQYLENTEENMLTIITFVENQPEYRRCLQAVEKEDE